MRFILLVLFFISLSSLYAFQVSNHSNGLREALLKNYDRLIASAKPRKQASNLQAIHPEATMKFMDYCNYYNYPVETHRITTEDGYILTVFRIQRKYSKITANLPVVFFQHGLLDSSEGWIINDESKAPAFVFANLGYDVWLGNVRGNKYSREHIHYDADKDVEFWQFSFDEMAKYDLPAYFTYVANYTGNIKINIIYIFLL